MRNFLLTAGVKILQFIYFFIKLLPRRRKVTMISRQYDDPSVDFVLLSKRLKQVYPEYKIVILSRKLTPSFSYAKHIFRQMYHIATSKVVLLDSYCIPISVLNHKKNLKVIQMWHSMGVMKAFGYAMIGKEEGNDADVARILKMHNNYDYVLISSMSYVSAYEDGFHVDPSVVREIPLPKTDLLIDREYMDTVRELVLSQNPELRSKKNIVYCPTFRVHESDLDYRKINELINSIDYSKYNLIYKAHPVSKIEIEEDRVITNIKDNISAVAVADYVISDYSSVIYEFGLADRPVFLYGYDWNNYQDKRVLEIDPSTEIPAFFSDDAGSVLEAIKQERFDHKAFNLFTKENIRLPRYSCVDTIIELMRL